MNETTETMRAYQVPLEHRLREVPQSLRLLLETDTSSSSTPVGYLCHEAADEIARLRTALAFARSVIKSGEPWTETCERELKL